MIDYRRELERRGYDLLTVGDRNVMMPCPFHQEEHASFGVSLKNGVYHCFGCGAKGKFFQLIAQLDDLDEATALRRLQESETVEEVTNELQQMLHEEGTEEITKYISAKWFTRTFVSIPDTAGELYLRERGVSADAVRRFGIRFASTGRYKDRVVLPIRKCPGGKIIAFTARSIHKDVRPKTMKFGRKSTVLYGLYELCRAGDELVRNKVWPMPRVALVEGEFDAIALQSKGIAAVAIMGSNNLSAAQAELLLWAAEEVVLMFDGDAAGYAAAEKMYSDLSPFMPAVVARLPRGKDPDDLLQSEAEQLFNKE